MHIAYCINDMIVARATLRYLRQSPRKARLVARLLVGCTLPEAERQLRLLGKRVAAPLLKLLRSAGASARQSSTMTAEQLYVRTLTVDGGPVLKRYMPKAFGRADKVRERTSHITITLEAKGQGSSAKSIKGKGSKAGI